MEKQKWKLVAKKPKYCFFYLPHKSGCSKIWDYPQQETVCLLQLLSKNMELQYNVI